MIQKQEFAQDYIEDSDQDQWEYSEDIYEERATSYKLATEAFEKNDSKIITKNHNISPYTLTKSKLIFENAIRSKGDANKYTSGQDMIFKNWVIEDQKYKEFSSDSQNYSDNQIQIDLPIQEDVLDIIDGDKTFGTMLFFCKIIQSDKNFNLKINKLKGHGDIPQVKKLQKKNNFYLFQINTVSDLRRFQIILGSEKMKLLTSKPYSFKNQIVDYDAKLSYDFLTDKQLPTNELQCLLASINFANVIDINFQQKAKIILSEKKQFFISNQFEIDSHTCQILLKSKNTEKILVVLQILLAIQDEIFLKKSDLLKNKTYFKLASIYMTLMMSYVPDLIQDKLINSFTIERYIKLFLHFRCISDIKKEQGKIIEGINENVLNKKIFQLIIILIQSKKMSLITQFFNVLNSYKLKYLEKVSSFDTLLNQVKESIITFDEDYVDLIASVIYHYIFIIGVQQAKFQQKIIEYIMRSFSANQFQFKNLEGQEKKSTTAAYFNQIAGYISFPKNKLGIFQDFYGSFIKMSVYQNFNSFTKNVKLIKTIAMFIKKLPSDLVGMKQFGKIQYGLQLLKRIYFDYNANKIFQLNQLSNVFDQILSIGKKKGQIQKMLQQHILFPLMLSGDNQNKCTIAQNLCSSLYENIIYFSFKQGIKILDEPFTNSIFGKQKMEKVYQDCLLTPLLNKYIDKKTIKKFIQEHSPDHNNWYNEFKYKKYINQAILQKIAKQATNYFVKEKNDIRDKTQYFKNLVHKIQVYARSDQEKQGLLCIIETDNFNIQFEEIMKILTVNKGKLSILRKIRQNKGPRAQELKIILSIIQEKIKNDQIGYNCLNDLTRNSNYQKNLMNRIFDYEIVAIIEQKEKQGAKFLQKISQYNSFITALTKFQIVDEKQTKEMLMRCQENFRKNSIKFNKIQGETFKKFNQNVLKCYNFQSFFANQKILGLKVQIIVERCNELYKRFINARDQIIKEFKQKKLTYKSLNYFEAEIKNVKLLKQIFLMDNDKIQDIDNLIDELMQVLSLIQKLQTQELAQLLKVLGQYVKIDQTKRLNGFSQKINEFLVYAKTIQKTNKNGNISNIFVEFDKLNVQMIKLKLNLNDKNMNTYNLLKFLRQMWINKDQGLKGVVLTKKFLKQLKVKCDQEDDLSINYEDLESCDLLAAYAETYLFNLTKFKELIKETKLAFQKSKGLINAPSLVFPKLKEIKNEIQNLKNKDRKTLLLVSTITKKSQIIIEVSKLLSVSVRINYVLQDQKRQIEQKKQVKIDCVQQSDLNRFKEQSIVFLSQNGNTQQKQDEETYQRVQQIKKFLDILKNIGQIKETWRLLEQWGYFLFKDQFIKIKIENKECYEIIKKNQELLLIKEKWTNEVKSIQKCSAKAALLQGHRLKSFYQVLVLSQFAKNSISFANICDTKLLQKFRLNKKPKAVNDDPFKTLKIILDFFEFLKGTDEQIIPINKDFSQKYVKSVVMSQQQDDFINGIVELDAERIKRLKLSQLLICTSDTKILDVKTFIETALLDNKNQYVIIRPQKLPNKFQQYIIDRIEQYKKQNQKNLLLKICLITSNSLQSLYKYLTQQLPLAKQQQNKLVRQNAYKQFIESKAKDVSIYVSAQPGYGKTTRILEDSKQKNRNLMYFPISGRPQAIFLFDRLCQISLKMDEQKQKKKFSLVIQISNIDENHIQIVNTFLSQIITGKASMQNGRFAQLPKDLYIYFEIQNITGTGPAKKKYNALKSLPILKEILKHKNCNLIQIKTLPKIKFHPRDVQTSYILKHLKMLKNKDIDKHDIPHYQTYKTAPDQFTQKEALQLLDQFFVKKLKNPTFYQFQYFIRLLFDGVKNFSKSFYLSTLNFTSNYDPQMITKFKLKQIRSQFLNVIVLNATQFIKRNVQYDQFDNKIQSKSQQKDEKMPFLIIPNCDGESFSFIYTDANKVPQAIRNFCVSQTPQLLKQVNPTADIKQLFNRQSLVQLQKTNPVKFNDNLSNILFNISNNKNYFIKKDPAYVVNLDNFFKMCLITLRKRQNIPIVIMGEAGIGKTAILNHVVTQLYQDQFLVININAGTQIDQLKKHLERVQKLSEEAAKKLKKLWVFFDEFNTLKEVGYIKQIMIEKSFLGKKQKFLNDVVIIGACNPFRKLKQPVMNNQMLGRQQKKEEKQNLAFHVLPPPHSMIECMWNYGSLSPYEYKMYISRMISVVDIKLTQTVDTILRIHDYYTDKFDASSVSLRDIQRFRKLYIFFCNKLPNQGQKKNVSVIAYNKVQERALILSFHFCYTLRLESKQMKKHVWDIMSKELKVEMQFIVKCKEIEQEDFYSRLNIQFQSIAKNNALKQNIYACFVCTYNKLPMIIVGQPGCSKSLAIRILCQNMKGINSSNAYLKNFQEIRSFNFQGSQLCTSLHVKDLFERAQKAKSKGEGNQKDKSVSIPLIVFDEIGLADKSKSNPLKVLHPYLQVNQQKQKQVDTRVSFIGISNTDLDVSKMSRMLVLRRPAPTKQDLIETAKGIGRNFENQNLKINIKIESLIQNISNSYFDFIKQWNERQKIGYRNFFSLRDFYSLIKQFLTMMTNQKVDTNNQDRKIQQLVEKAIYKNFNGQMGSVELFMQILYKNLNKVFNVNQIYKEDSVQSVLSCLQKQNLRFPLLIVPDLGSISYLVNLLENKFNNQVVYFEKSPFKDDKQSSKYVIQTTTNVIQSLKKGQKIILNNIQSTIQTSLYDMFNKFYIKRGDQNFCKIATSETGLVKTVKVHQSFNCVVIILQGELMETQPPFLSRFQKHRFSINKTKLQKRAEQISEKIQIFKKQIMQELSQAKLSHYKFQSMFINCGKQALKTLILKCFNEQLQKNKIQQEDVRNQENSKSPNDIIVEKIIKQMVMNCSQQFNFIFKFIIEKRNNLRYIDVVSQVLKKKFEFQLVRNTNLIIFTTESQTCLNQHSKEQTKTLQTKFIKHQESFDDEIETFINSTKVYLYIDLKLDQTDKIIYLISQIQKIKKKYIISGQGALLKHKRIYFLMQLNRDQKLQSLFISYLSNYKQIFYEGKIDELKITKQDFFKDIFSLKNVFSVVFGFFNYQYKAFNTELVPKIREQFVSLLKGFQLLPENLLYRHCEDYINGTVGVNIQLNQATLTQILLDIESFKQCKNLKSAITKNLAQKQYNAVVAVFFKYLFQKQSFLSYSPQIYQMYKVQMCRFDIGSILQIQNAKKTTQYKLVVDLLLKSKYSVIKKQYTDMKMQKRLPSLQRMPLIMVNRPRLFHFSKAQCDIIFSKQGKQSSLSALAKKTVCEQQKFDKNYQIFLKQFNKKSSFVFKQNNQDKQNLYKIINQNSEVKDLLLLDLITDLCEIHGLKFDYILEFRYLFQTFIMIKSCPFQKIIFTLLAFQNVFVQIFKLFTIIFEHKIILPSQNSFKDRIEDGDKIYNQLMSSFCNTLIITSFFESYLSKSSSIKEFGGPKQFYQIFINSMFQIQSLQKICQNIVIPKNLLLVRDVILFFSEYDEGRKYQLTSKYIQNMKVKQTFISAYKFTEELYEKENVLDKKNLILKFQANKIFLQWFINGTQKQCIDKFIKKCDENSTFCHNSIAIINYLLSKAKLDCQKLNQAIQILGKSGKIQEDLIQFGKECKKQKYANNLSVLLVNLFFQKLLKAHNKKTDKQIIQQNLQNFKLYYPKICTNSIESPLLHIFLIALIKKILISYAQCIKTKQNIDQSIGEYLNNDNQFSKNCRFFCTKVLRKSMISKQIKDNYVKIKRFQWSQKIQEYFIEEQARAIIVPKDNIEGLPKDFSSLMDQIQKSQGSDFQSLGKLIQLGKNNFESRYSILNFFFRFYYTLSYNEKNFKAKTIQYLQKQKGNIQKSLGKYQAQLILNYAQNKITSQVFIQKPQDLNEDHLPMMNFINLLTSSKESINPFHSLFFAKGVVHQNFSQVIDGLFFPSGLQNPYINIARSVIELTTNNNIGVYICCSECDYIYSHLNCGWPNQSTKCPMCGEQIGGNGGHKLFRLQKGARRLMTPALIDNKGAYYVSGMTKVQLYWQMQRKYIEVEINRMNLKKEVLVNKKPQKITGYNVCNSGRTSNLTYKIFKYFLESTLYWLISNAYIKPADVLKIFNKETNVVIKDLYLSANNTLQQVKTDLNLGNKFNGWMFGMQRNFIIKLQNFKEQFDIYQKGLIKHEAELVEKLQKQIAQRKQSQDYLNLYIEFVKVLKNGFISKQAMKITQLTASSAFTRNLMENLLEGQIKLRTNESKFDFSVANQKKQGKMQFPFDPTLTQDQIDFEKFMYARVFKLPDSQIKYNQIINKYQILIKQNYPFLDLILKQSERFIQMDNFFKVIEFVNQLHKYIENKCERAKSEMPIRQYLKELKDQHNQSLTECLKQPQVMLKAWRNLAKYLGVLQNGCKIVGKMNDDYNLQTQMKAFVLDNSSKQNVYGMIIASLFHNFGVMHNQVTSLLNSRKNLVPSYKNLSLFNELLKVHPQKLNEQNVFKISEDQFSEKLYECSVSSINYGQNFIFNNFDAYQDFFVKKLDKKCQIIPDLQKLVSVCYNGQAFSAGLQDSSNPIVEILQKFNKKIDQQRVNQIKQKLKNLKSQQQKETQKYQQILISMRGSLQKAMIVINSIKGSIKGDQNLIQLFKQLNISQSLQKTLKISPFKQIITSQIIHLYEILEQQLKFTVFKHLPQKYKQKLSNQMALQLQQFFKTLPVEQNQQSATVGEVSSAICKFIIRNLQGGIFDSQKKLMVFVTNRVDFWPNDYADQKKYALMSNIFVESVPVKYCCNVLQILQKVRQQRKN